MSVGRICHRDVDVIAPDESVQTAAGRMHARKVGALVVIDRNEQPRGILTDRDLAIRVVAQGLDPAQTTVDEVMTSTPHTVREGTTIEDALRIMRTGCFRRLPVVDNSGRLIGVLSLDDVLDRLSKELVEIGTLVEQEGPRSFACV